MVFMGDGGEEAYATAGPAGPWSLKPFYITVTAKPLKQTHTY